MKHIAKKLEERMTEIDLTKATEAVAKVSIGPPYSGPEDMEPIGYLTTEGFDDISEEDSQAVKAVFESNGVQVSFDTVPTPFIQWAGEREPDVFAVVIEREEWSYLGPQHPPRIKGFKAWLLRTNKKAYVAWRKEYREWVEAGCPPHKVRIRQHIPRASVEQSYELDGEPIDGEYTFTMKAVS